MQQCSILFVNPGIGVARQPATLAHLGFRVTEVEEVPPTADLLSHHVVVVATRDWQVLPLLGAHLRAKPQFGRRALIALVPANVPARAHRDAVASGFDAALPVSAGGRELAATFLRTLRGRPEHRCALRPMPRSRRAA